MTRPFFSRDRINHFDIFDRHVEDALNKLAERLKEGVPVDFQVYSHLTKFLISTELGLYLRIWLDDSRLILLLNSFSATMYNLSQANFHIRITTLPTRLTANFRRGSRRHSPKRRLQHPSVHGMVGTGP